MTASPSIRPELVEGPSFAGKEDGRCFDKLSANGREGKAFPLRFQGYAALFDRVDRAGDVFRAGAFAGARAVPLLWQHRGNPVGEIVVLDEDARGLRVEGVIADPDVARLVRTGALPGLSVGFRAERARQGAWRELLAVALIEVSLVASPMQPGARIERLD